MTPEEFREHGHALIDWLANYHVHLAEQPVMSRNQPGELAALLPEAPPDQPEPFGEVLADLDRLVVPGLSHWQHPRFFGYFPSNALLAGVLGDFVSTGLGVLGLSWQSSPAITEIEDVVLGWVRRMVGLSEAWHGVIQDTASTSTLVALITARERTTEYALTRGGLQAETRPLMIYVSAQSHSSVDKAALLAGFGRHNLRLVPCDEKHAMRATRSRRWCRRISRLGCRPARWSQRREQPRRQQSILWERLQRLQGVTVCGCMWTPRWRAAP